MENSINIFHNEHKILSAFDNTFFKKNGNEWEKINNKKIFKGTDVPNNMIGSEGDYYIYYSEISNYIINSENFTSEGWINLNNNFRMDTSLIYPNSNCFKMIPNQEVSKHYIAYKFANPIIDNMPFWCFSLYVRPNEYNYFELALTDDSETNGIKVRYSITLDTRKQYVVDYSLTKIGDLSPEELIYDESTYGIIKETNGFYRIFIAAQFTNIGQLQCKFSILKNQNGVILEEFANNNLTSGLFINSAQLSKSIGPIEYILSNGNISKVFKYGFIYQKGENNIWNKLPSYISVYYGSENPKKYFGQSGDLYFHNPIIKVGEFVRFGKNTLFKCWRKNNSDDICYTEYAKPSTNDDVYIYNESPKIIGKVSSYNEESYSSSGILILSNIVVNNEIYYRDENSDERFIKEPGVVFWNVDKDTYGYISSDGKVHNLTFNGKSLYNFDNILNSMTFSTNLFQQTYNTRYTISKPSYEMGINSGGHWNFTDYNSLRKYY